ncbi:MAG: helix-turn-helix transcriptional regulator [Lachnospiraceae bacterium]|jgi:DNA-binding Xre family transcriptional regulator|nr:helix-turn-helix transcriptional regulator [Lachnospiraceae bacterium]MCH4027949.1 helix-turn-helix transcriptional regulator [Lachnospiraceae bacterium]MCH4065793.1 helix-turn-helix transcriptional regulator [Lachnospiraceae bacterium]MCH4111829.1 helix-turn-helix transcriptional regulator [Lachnospiraceae bacterium]MCI1352372.1 helix-turn-helix transcriptional regulator [Lachnospiraceae bacterium]
MYKISYKKLWKLLIDKNMTKMDLKDAAGVSAASIAKLGKGGNITTDVLLKICNALDCRLEDIMETVKTSTVKRDATPLVLARGHSSD